MKHSVLNSKKSKLIGLIIALMILSIIAILSLSLGQYHTKFYVVLEAIINYDNTDTNHIVIMSSRLSRTIIAITLGGALAVSGAFMQALTRNPLASPSLFGINSGALFCVVFATVFLNVYSLVHLSFFAFFGAMISAIMVFVLGSIGRDSLSPIKIVLSGAAISAFFSSFTQGLLVIDEQSLEGVLFWLGGSVSGRTFDMIKPLLPLMILAFVCAYLLSNSINILSSGDDIAKGLGQNVIFIKTIMAIIIIILAGGSVAVGGAIGFIGLIVPHIVKGLVGNDYKWITPYCMIVGSSLLMAADVVSRLIVMPEEMPIGVITALMGAPFFVFIARKVGTSHA